MIVERAKLDRLLCVALLTFLVGCMSKPLIASQPQPVRRGRLRWTVEGRVTDEQGRVLSDVEVVAKGGEGRLRETGRTTTDNAGSYTLTFTQALVDPSRPGEMLKRLTEYAALHDLPPPSENPEIFTECVRITVSRPGYRQTSPSDGAGLLITDVKAPIGSPWDVYLTGIAYPDQPYRLDLVMAASPASATGSEEEMPPAEIEQLEEMAESDMLRALEAYRKGRHGQAIRHYRSALTMLEHAGGRVPRIAKHIEMVKKAMFEVHFEAQCAALRSAREWQSRGNTAALTVDRGQSRPNWTGDELAFHHAAVSRSLRTDETETYSVLFFVENTSATPVTVATGNLVPVESWDKDKRMPVLRFRFYCPRSLDDTGKPVVPSVVDFRLVTLTRGEVAAVKWKWQRRRRDSATEKVRIVYEPRPFPYGDPNRFPYWTGRIECEVPIKGFWP